MTWIIFEAETKNRGKAEEILRDDLISRQSVLMRDAESLNYPEEVLFIKIEGSEGAVKKARELFETGEIGKAVNRKKAQSINEKIQAQESSAVQGMGFIFG